MGMSLYNVDIYLTETKWYYSCTMYIGLSVISLIKTLIDSDRECHYVKPDKHFNEGRTVWNGDKSKYQHILSRYSRYSTVPKCIAYSTEGEF